MAFLRMVRLLPAVLATCIGLVTGSPTSVIQQLHCRNIPGDNGWPTDEDWAQLNKTVDGQLLSIVPIAAVCHDPSFNAEKCNSLKASWEFSSPYIGAPADVLAPIFQNQTCDPFTTRETPCTLGSRAPFSIRITKVRHIQAGLEFVRKHNIRLTIKNTGHDFLGKSTGKGSLSLWTHHLQSIEFIEKYSSSLDYDGPAVRVGAGVISKDIQAALHARGHRILVGSCPTVGFAGGFTSGGGHGLLTSEYGLSADNVLEWEVVTAGGEHLTATPETNADIYWALAGGGAGTFAVVVSTTVRAYPDDPVAATSTAFDVGMAGGVDEFWNAVTTFQSNLGSVVDEGVTVPYLITSEALIVPGFVSPTGDLCRARKILGPLGAAMKDAGVPLHLAPSRHDSYQDMYNRYFLDTFSNVPEAQITAGRMIPRHLLEDEAVAADITQAFRKTVEAGFTLICVGLNANRSVPPYANAVFPLWRTALLHCIVSRSWDFKGPWNAMLDMQELLANTIMPDIESVTPGGGAYLNEANFQQPNWQEVFYGENYERLSSIKEEYDPDGVLYAHTAVGSERWSTDAEGRLCRR